MRSVCAYNHAIIVWIISLLLDYLDHFDSPDFSLCAKNNLFHATHRAYDGRVGIVVPKQAASTVLPF